MNLIRNGPFYFDHFLPLYNWIYPVSGRSKGMSFLGRNEHTWLCDLTRERATSRALYFHIPFCETICTFCPFVRGTYRNDTILDAYCDALCQEIRIKSADRSLSDTRISAVFFGGGTPSVLAPYHIQKIGRTLKDAFDLTQLDEFSVEFEVKSATLDKIESFKEIGATHARFGLQTLSPKYRSLFDLTASIEQIYSAVERFARAFNYVSADVLFGMNGQTVDDLIEDVSRIAGLGLRNLDLYPINNTVIQRKLATRYRNQKLSPISGEIKHFMRLLVRELLREHGYVPHNGHGYVRSTNAQTFAGPVSAEYSFVYHEHVYGYATHDVIGFGASAISSSRGFSITNIPSREQYIKETLSGRGVPITIFNHSEELDACRPIALRLPYHGDILDDLVDWNSIPGEVLSRLDNCIEAGLVERNADRLLLSQHGWEWYSNLMYFLMPVSERAGLDSVIATALKDTGRDIEKLLVTSIAH